MKTLIILLLFTTVAFSQVVTVEQSNGDVFGAPNYGRVYWNTTPSEPVIEVHIHNNTRTSEPTYYGSQPTSSSELTIGGKGFWQLHREGLERMDRQVDSMRLAEESKYKIQH